MTRTPYSRHTSQSTRAGVLVFACFLFPVTLLSGCLQQDPIDVHFSPAGGGQVAIVEELEQAKESICVCMYYFTDRRLAEALCQARTRGVDVRVVLDSRQRQARQAQGSWLCEQAIAVRYYSPPSRGILHHKFAVIDGRTVIGGSYNWTDSADTRNAENLTITESPVVAARYMAVFEELWHKGLTP